MKIEYMYGPHAACYGDDDPTERLLVFAVAPSMLLRVSLDREVAELVDTGVANRREIIPFSAEDRRKLLDARSEQVARIVRAFKMPADFAA